MEEKEAKGRKTKQNQEKWRCCSFSVNDCDTLRGTWSRECFFWFSRPVFLNLFLSFSFLWLQFWQFLGQSQSSSLLISLARPCFRYQSQSVSHCIDVCLCLGSPLGSFAQSDRLSDWTLASIADDTFDHRSSSSVASHQHRSASNSSFPQFPVEADASAAALVQTWDSVLFFSVTFSCLLWSWSVPFSFTSFLFFAMLRLCSVLWPLILLDHCWKLQQRADGRRHREEKKQHQQQLMTTQQQQQRHMDRQWWRQRQEPKWEPQHKQEIAYFRLALVCFSFSSVFLSFSSVSRSAFSNWRFSFSCIRDHVVVFNGPASFLLLIVESLWCCYARILCFFLSPWAPWRRVPWVRTQDSGIQSHNSQPQNTGPNTSKVFGTKEQPSQNQTAWWWINEVDYEQPQHTCLVTLSRKEEKEQQRRGRGTHKGKTKKIIIMLFCSLLAAFLFQIVLPVRWYGHKWRWMLALLIMSLLFINRLQGIVQMHPNPQSSLLWSAWDSEWEGMGRQTAWGMTTFIISIILSADSFYPVLVSSPRTRMKIASAATKTKEGNETKKEIESNDF